MSGGSYDYLYCKEPGNKTQGIVDRIDDLVSDLERALEANQADVYECVDGKKKHVGYRALTDIEKMAVDIALARLVRFADKARPLLEQASSLDGILHAIEWFRSCDWGPSGVVEECMKALEKQVGVPLKVTP